MERRNKDKKDKSEQEVLHAFADLFDEVLDEDIEDVDTALQALGYDPATIEKKMKNVAEQALARSPLDWRNRARQGIQREQERLASFSAHFGQARAQVKQQIAELLEQAKRVHGEEAVAHFRNLEELTDEDLADVAEELMYLLSKQDDPGSKEE